MTILVENLVLRFFGVVLGVLFLIRTFKQKFHSLLTSILWYSSSSLLIIVSAYPTILVRLGISGFFVRILDSLIIFSILGLYFLVFKLFQQNEENNRAITNLVREVALKFKEKKID